MDSQTAIVTPSHLTRFAECLEDSAKHIRNEGRKMRESVTAAHSVWKDEKYDTFNRQLENCVEELEKFSKTGQKYADFLQEKAHLAQKFLNNRR